MKVYGWNDTGPHRGEMLAAEVHARELYFGSGELAAALGWEAVFTSFHLARRSLLFEMKLAGAGEEQIAAVRNMKASYIPVVEVIE